MAPTPARDTTPARRVLAGLADEADSLLFKAARHEAGQRLLEELIVLKVPGVTLFPAGANAVTILIGNKEAQILNSNGRVEVFPPEEREHRKKAPLTLDPIAGTLVGPPYDGTDPATGERVTRYRDALLTVVEVAASFLRTRPE